jgi:GNAT superfamily N-acetyltransferase
MGPLTFRRIRASADASWRPLMKLYEEAFEEGQRETERAILQNLDTDAFPREGGHLVIVAEEMPGVCLGGVLFSYLPAIDCGYVSYLVVAQLLRDRGIGTQILAETHRYLDDEAARVGHAPVRGIFTELEREDPGNPDTFRRFRFWARNGVRPLAVDWRYPALHGGQPPVPMYLAFGGLGGPPRWYPLELKNVATAIFDATYSYLPASVPTLAAIMADLDRMPPDQAVPYLSPGLRTTPDP